MREHEQASACEIPQEFKWKKADYNEFHQKIQRLELDPKHSIHENDRIDQERDHIDVELLCLEWRVVVRLLGCTVSI